MVCITHSTNIDTFRRLIEARRWVRLHDELEPLMRRRFFLAEHWAGRIRDRDAQRYYVVDSWYFDNGYAAAIFPAEDWLAGRHPDGA